MFLGNRQAYRVLDGGDEEAVTHNSDDEGHHQNNAPPKSHDIGSVNIDVGKNPDISRSKQEHRWDHIENIDQFFGLVYEYHQGSGFICIALRQAFALFQFIFVIFFSTFLLQCVDYDVLFNNANVTTTGEPIIGKIQIGDAVVPYCTRNFNPIVVFTLLLATMFWLCQLVCIGYRMFQLCEIRTFYATALEIPDAEMSNVTWEEVVDKLCVLQPKLQLIINQETLTPLDVYQRILRFKNYFIGLVYNDILPPRICLPGGSMSYYLSSGLRFNLEWLLFWGPWSPWKNSYSLRDEFKDKANLETLADKMRTAIAWMSVMNLVFFPFILLYQVLFNFFSAADSIKREPGFFGMRKFSIYGKERLRHFNELDHELNARLNSCYGFSVRYMNQFISPIAEIVAKTVAFMAGSIFAVLFILSAIDEVVVNVEHVLSVMTVCGVAVIACRTFIPSENFFPCQKLLMEKIIGGIHYAPKSWLRKAFTTEVYQEFSQLFQMKAQILVEELASPLVTPILLYFSIRPKASALILFFYNHTHHDEQLGDVCSYSVMDITRDGDDSLKLLNESMTRDHGLAKNLIRKPASCGKVELSLLNFVKMYPSWQPPSNCGDFIQKMRLLAQQEMQQDSLDMIMQGSRDLSGSMQMSSVPAKYVAPVAVSGSTALSQNVPPHHHEIIAVPSFSDDHHDNYAIHFDHSQMEELDALNVPCQCLAKVDHHETEEDDDEIEVNIFRQFDDKNPSLPPSSQCMMDTTGSMDGGAATATSTFIQPYPLDSQLGGGSSRHLMDPDVRAMDMSYNALALNRILASTISRQPAQGTHIGSGRRAGRSLGGYGALSSQIRGGEGTDPAVSFRGGNNGAPTASRYMMTGSAATSHLYGVPEASQMLLRNLDDED